jgi:hypothetical protein
MLFLEKSVGTKTKIFKADVECRGHAAARQSILRTAGRCKRSAIRSPPCTSPDPWDFTLFMPIPVIIFSAQTGPSLALGPGVGAPVASQYCMRS